MVLRIVVCRKEDKHTGTDRCNDGDNSEGMKKGECCMTTISFPVIQIEKTGKRLRNMRKENGIRVAALCEYMGGISEQAVYKWERGACLPTMYRWKTCWYTKRPRWPLLVLLVNIERYQWYSIWLCMHSCITGTG